MKKNSRNTLSNENFGSKIYSRFPPAYIEADELGNCDLKRYLNALNSGGYSPIIKDTNGLLSIPDPTSVRSDILPLLFKQYGLELFHGIPEEYMRYLLPNLGEAWNTKGSINTIDYVATSLSGIKTTTTVIKNASTFRDGFAFDKMVFSNFSYPIIMVELEMDYTMSDFFPNSSQFEKVLKNFVPFYCDLLLVYKYVYEIKADLTTAEKSFDVVHYLPCVDNPTFNAVEKESIRISLNTISEVGALNKKTVANSHDGSLFDLGGTFNYMIFAGDTIRDVDEQEYRVREKYKQDDISTRVTENLSNKLVLSAINDTPSFPIYGLTKEHSAVLGVGYSATFNDSIFGNDKFDNKTEFTKNVIKMTAKSDNMSLNKGYHQKDMHFGGFVFNSIPEADTYYESGIQTKYVDNSYITTNDNTESIVGLPTKENSVFRFGVIGVCVFGDSSLSKTRLTY